MAEPRRNRNRVLTGWVIGLIVALAVVAEVFVAWPGIDLWVSRAVFVEGEGFWLQNTPVSYFVDKDFRRILTVVLILVIVAAIVAGIWRRPVLGFTGREYAYVILSLAIGAGLIVNEGYKSFSGRARPKDVVEFGGPLAFSPAFVSGDQCRQNCSFVSGDAAMGFGFLAFALVAGRRRRWAIPLALSFGTLWALQRIVQGKHFLSDVVVASLVSTLVVLVLYELVIVRRLGPADLAVGVRRLAGRGADGRHRAVKERRPAPGDQRGQQHVAQVVPGGADDGKGRDRGEPRGDADDAGIGIGEGERRGDGDDRLRAAGEERVGDGVGGDGAGAAGERGEPLARGVAAEQDVGRADEHGRPGPGDDDEQQPAGVVPHPLGGGGEHRQAGPGDERQPAEAGDGGDRDRVGDEGGALADPPRRGLGQLAEKAGQRLIDEQEAQHERAEDAKAHGGREAAGETGGDGEGRRRGHGAPYPGPAAVSRTEGPRR